MLHYRCTFSRARRAGKALACALAIGSATGVAPRVAAANPAAEALFREGKRLLKAGKLEEACRKLAQSQSLDPTPGTLLNVATCHEQEHKPATAWAEFLAASRLAEARGQRGRSQEARRRASLLEPKLPHLTISVVSDVPGLTVKRNDEAFDATLLGSRLPVDPGEYVVTAEAAGYEPFRTSVVIKSDGEEVRVEIPALAAAPSEAPGARLAREMPAPAPVHKRANTFTPKRIAGLAAGGVGVAAVGVGAAFGLMASASYAKADDACPDRTGCSPKAVDDRDRALTQAWVSNVGFGVGLIGLAAGSYLLFFPPSKPKLGAAPGQRTGVVVVPQPTGFVAVGRFLRFTAKSTTEDSCDARVTSV